MDLKQWTLVSCQMGLHHELESSVGSVVLVDQESDDGRLDLLEIMFLAERLV